MPLVYQHGQKGGLGSVGILLLSEDSGGFDVVGLVLTTDIKARINDV